MNSDGHIAVTKTGAEYVLGWTSYFCGVWKAGNVMGIPEYNYPPTPTGWEQACAQFEKLEALHAALERQNQVTESYTPIPQEPSNYVATSPTASPTTPNLEQGNTEYAVMPQSVPESAYSEPAYGKKGSFVPPVLGETGVHASPATYGSMPNPGVSGQNISIKQPEAALQKSASVLWQFSAGAVMIVGIVVGIIGLFPKYASGISSAQNLVSSGTELAPHIFYLAAWCLGASFIFAGSNFTAFGSKLSFGISLVSFGLFVTDIASGINTSYIGPGMALSVASWVLCTGGAIMAYFGAGGKEQSSTNQLYIGKFSVAIILAFALAVAILYVPSWDSYTYTSLISGVPISHTYTAGDAFQLPAPLIAGAVATAAAFFLTVLYTLIMRKNKSNYWLFGGAILVMLGQVVSAYIQQANPYTATGISQATAQAHGIVITDGFTPVFYGFFICLIVLMVFLASDMTAAGYYSGRSRDAFASFQAPQNTSSPIDSDQRW